MPTELLVATSISKSFGAVKALQKVHLRVRPGEIVALAGENGSGKSTLARILAGSLPRDEGRVVFDGVEREFVEPRAALDAGIAMVTQELTAVPGMSVAENVLLTELQRPHSIVRRHDLSRRARPYLRLVGVELDPRTPFAVLKPGVRELVEVAKALAARPRLLILDEATTRLTQPERLFRLVEQLAAEQGLATIFITQRLHEICQLAHRVVVLRDGQNAGELCEDELSEDRLSTLMVGRDLSGYFHKRKVLVGDVVLRLDSVVTDRSDASISIEVRAGEIVGLAGLVGSGRSELLETIAGLRRPVRGRIEVLGQALRPGSTIAAVSAGVILLPEDRLTQALLLDASVATNIALASWRTFWPASRSRELDLALSSVRRFRIRTAGLHACIGTLSGGNQQKVVIARCLSRQPRVLLLDEPTRGVDVGAREEIYAIIAELVDQGVGILMASSDLPELLGLCDRIVVLNEGRVATELSSAEASEEKIVRFAAGENGQ